MKQLLTALLLIFSMAQVSYAEKAFYCNTKVMTGISVDNGVWKVSTIENPSSELSITLKFNYDYTRVVAFAGLSPLICSTLSNSSSVICDHYEYGKRSGKTVMFNTDNNEFIWISPSIWDSPKLASHSSLSSMQAGTCETF